MTDTIVADTIVAGFFQRLESSGAGVAFRHLDGRTTTWNQFADEVACTAALLRRLGVQPGDHVAMYSENRYEWLVVDLAIQLVPAVHVPIHAPLSGAQAAYQVSHSGAQVLFVSGQELFNRLSFCRHELSDELTIISFDTCAAANDLERPPRMADIVEPAHAQVDMKTAMDAGRQLTAGSLATILYTSGTTGEPKGVQLTQGNLASNVVAVTQAIPFEDRGVRLTFLPLSHVFARLCDMYVWIFSKLTELAIAESRDTVLRDCADMKPRWINGVPYFFDRCHRYLESQELDQQPGTVRQLFGGNIEFCCSGGAALPDHLFDFYLQQDVPVLQGYGLTETSPVITFSSPDNYRRGSVGVALSGVDVKIAEDGEILTRGPHVMPGYYRDEAATRDAIRDEWLYTGDLGKMDDDGYLYITGRKKEIIVTAGGKNIAPVMLESLLTEEPLFQQCMVVGEGQKYLTALIVLDRELLTERLATVGAEYEQADLLRCPATIHLVQQCIERQLVNVSRYEHVQKFVLLDRPFSIEAGEMTPKLSLRRAVISERFRDEIDAMYE